MKSVHELSAEEFGELKQRYIIEFDLDEDRLLDTQVEEYYEGTYFVEEDFWCNLSENEESVIEALNLTQVQVLQIVKEWYTNGHCPDIFQNEDGEDLEEFLEKYLN
jgi:hypothetical protein